jgi:hypothetical protein
MPHLCIARYKASGPVAGVKLFISLFAYKRTMEFVQLCVILS